MHKTTTTLMMLLLAGWLLGGCASDPTAPHDDLPAIEEEDVAGQAGYMAMALAGVGPLALEFGGKADASDGRYAYTFFQPEIQGVVQLYFETDGLPSSFTTADFARSWTEEEAPLSIYPIVDGLAWLVAFTLESDIDQGAGTAVVDGAGTLTLGSYVADWDVVGLAVEEDGDWPAAGVLTFTNEGITATVTFDGDETVTIEVGELVWSFDLENGTLTEL
jgi:hypothetical protein